MIAALRAASRRVKRSPLKSETAPTAPGGLDAKPMPARSDGALHVSEVVLEQLDGYIEYRSQLLELVLGFDEQGKEIITLQAC